MEKPLLWQKAKCIAPLALPNTRVLWVKPTPEAGELQIVLNRQTQLWEKAPACYESNWQHEDGTTLLIIREDVELLPEFAAEVPIETIAEDEFAD